MARWIWVFWLVGMALGPARAEIPELEALWPRPFPAIGHASLRNELTARIRKKISDLGRNGIHGHGKERISRAVVLLPKDRAAAGVLMFQIEGGPDRGIHQCEALGRGATSLTPKPGWIKSAIRESGGRSTEIHYAPITEEGGATIPGLYDLRVIRPREYKIKILNVDVTGEEALVHRISPSDREWKDYFSGVWKHWYPRDADFETIAPVDMLWSEAYQPDSQGASFPVYQRDNVVPSLEQTQRNSRYYYGPYGKYGAAVHTDRWDDSQTEADEALKQRNEYRSFLFRDTMGCVKVHRDCLMLLDQFIEEQAAAGRRVQLDVRERTAD